MLPPNFNSLLDNAINYLGKYQRALEKNSSSKLTLEHSPRRLKTIFKQLSQNQDGESSNLKERCAEHLRILANLPDFFEKLDKQLSEYINQDLMEQDVQKIGSSLWKMRTLFINKRLNIMSKKECTSFSALHSTMHLLKHQIRQSSAKEKKQDVVIKEFIERFFPISLPPEMLDHLVKSADSGQEALRILSLSTNTSTTCSMTQTAVNEFKIPVSIIVNSPGFNKNYLLNLKYLDFTNVDLTDEVLEIIINSEIEELILPDNFNSPIPSEILIKLKSLTMGKAYNQPIPAGLDLRNLHTWKMGRDYNQPIPAGLDLSNLHTWKMGRDYNQPIPEGLNLSKLRELTMASYKEAVIVGLNLSNLHSWTILNMNL